MKTTIGLWIQYINSWPPAWYMDDVEETINGDSFDKDYTEFPPDSILEITSGYIDDGAGGKDLIRHFAAWKRSLAHKTIVVQIDKAQEAEFLAALKSLGGKVVV
jgi:hypothetical protein